MDFKLLLSLSLFIFANSTLASTTTFNSNDYLVGTDITNAISGTKIEQYNHTNGSNDIVYSPATISSVLCDPLSVIPCQRNVLDLGNNNIEYFIHLDLGSPLNTVASFSGLSISFDETIDYFSASAFSNSGDTLDVFLFDSDNHFIRSIGVSGVHKMPLCIGSEVDCFFYNFNESLIGEDVGRIAIGAEHAVVYLDSMKFIVPETSALALLLLGLIGLTFTQAKQETK